MKRSSLFIVFLSALAIFCILTGCQKSREFQTVFPLDAATVNETLTKAGLPGSVREDETYSQQEGHVSYTIRRAPEHPNEPEDGVFVASVSSVQLTDGRLLYTTFVQHRDSNEFQWSDWKQQIVSATMLYGGFADEEAVYQALTEQGVPSDGENQWEVELPEGYCRVSYGAKDNKTYDEDGFEVHTYTATLRVDMFETRALYESLMASHQNS